MEEDVAGEGSVTILNPFDDVPMRLLGVLSSSAVQPWGTHWFKVG